MTEDEAVEAARREGFEMGRAYRAERRLASPQAVKMYYTKRIEKPYWQRAFGTPHVKTAYPHHKTGFLQGYFDE